MIKGRILGGRFNEILIRKKQNTNLELGELLVAESSSKKVLLQVYDLLYGSQISRQNLEFISGLSLEENKSTDFMDPNLRNYQLAMIKNIVTINNTGAKASKDLPDFFSDVRIPTKEDFTFLTKPKDPLLAGYIRSGSENFDIPVYLPSSLALSHHILIAGTTGKGKSVLMSNLLWNLVGKGGLLVLDPHDEYYGRKSLGLKDHPDKEKIIYYSIKNVPSGERTLKLNLKDIKPDHLSCIPFTPPQIQAMNSFYKKYKENWIEACVLEKPIGMEFNEASLSVLKRRLLLLLDIDVIEEKVHCKGAFDLSSGVSTVKDIIKDLSDEKVVIIDTSFFSGHVELLIGSIITTEILNYNKQKKRNGELHTTPTTSIVLEEAPRVLGKDILEKSSNVFASVAREGRKFKVGLIAITQLPSLIPGQILANINTKIILGIEMNTERQAIIDSASQDLSKDGRNIASLDKGEAILSSNFAKFAIPIKIPFFPDVVRKQLEELKQNKPQSNIHLGGIK